MQLFLKLYFLVILRVSERQQNYKSARKEAYLEFIPLASIDMMIPKTKHIQTPWYSREFKNISVHNTE